MIVKCMFVGQFGGAAEKGEHGDLQIVLVVFGWYCFRERFLCLSACNAEQK